MTPLKRYDSDESTQQSADLEVGSVSFRFRPIQPEDKDVVQKLHEEWFPVRYQTDFYEELAQQKMGGEPLYTSLAILPDQQVAACIVGAYVQTQRLSEPMRKMLVCDPSRYTTMFYIMTLGTITECRHCGLATRLVTACMETVEQDPSCGVLYLHVITFNTAAIRFYEKLGFERIQEIPNYYNINGEQYNCFLYAKFYHGNRAPGLYGNLVSAVSQLWRSFLWQWNYIIGKPRLRAQ